MINYAIDTFERCPCFDTLLAPCAREAGVEAMLQMVLEEIAELDSYKQFYNQIKSDMQTKEFKQYLAGRLGMM